MSAGGKELEAERGRLFAQLSVVGDFRRGSVSENWRRCGKPNCACAAPEHPGHGPRFLWTRSAGRRKTVARRLAAGEVGKVRREIARHAEFATTVEKSAEVDALAAEAARALDCGHGHEAVFAGYREKVIDTVKTQAWRLQVAPARHQAVAACATCPGPGGRSGGVTSPGAGGSVSAAMQAVSRRRI